MTRTLQFMAWMLASSALAAFLASPGLADDARDARAHIAAAQESLRMASVAGLQMELRKAEASLKQVSDWKEKRALWDEVAAVREPGNALSSLISKFREIESYLSRGDVQVAKLNMTWVQQELARWPAEDEPWKTLYARLLEIEDGLTAKVELEPKLAAAATKLWPQYVAVHGASNVIPMDPIACVRQIATWTGKTVVFEEPVEDRRGREYDGAYDMILVVNGSPVAARFDPALAKSWSGMVETVGKTYERQTYKLIGVIEGICRVDQREWREMYREWRVISTLDAPLIRVVALKSGVYAAGVGQSTSLDIAG